MPDVEYSSSLDESEVLKSLKNIDRNIDKIANNGKKGFKSVGDSAKKAGVEIGAISGIVQSITNSIINMARQGARALVEFGKESVSLAKNQLGVEAQLEQVIISTGKAAGLSADEIKAMATELQGLTNYGDEAILRGQNLLLTFTNIGKDVFPQATSTMLDMSEALDQDLKSSAIQLGKALNDPVKGITALQRVGVSFTEEQKKMVEAMVAAGRTADAQRFILAELNREFGGSAEAARAADGGFTAMKNALGDLQELFGTGLLAGAGDAFERIAKAMESDTAKGFAEAMGFLAAKIVEIISSGFFEQFENIDTETIGQLSESIKQFAASLEGTETADFSGNIDTLIQLLTALLKVFTLVNQIQTYFNNKVEEGNKAVGAYKAIINALRDGLVSLITPIGPLLGAFKALDNLLKQTTGVSIVEGLDQAISDFENLSGELDTSYENLTKTVKDNAKEISDTDIEAPDTSGLTNELKDTEKEVKTAADKIKDAIEGFNDDIEKENTRHGRANEDIMRDFARKQIDLELEISQERADLITDNNRRVEDIERKFAQDRQKIEKELGQKDKELLNKQADDRIALQKESKKKLVDIEADYRKQIRDIEQQYQQSIEDAIDEQDSFAFISAIKQREKAIEEADKARQDKVNTAQLEADQRQAILLEQQAKEREQLSQANQQRLTDIQDQYNREIEENNIKLSREEADLETSAQRRRDKLATDLERRLEDERINHSQKLEDLSKALSDEVREIEKAEKEKKDKILKETKETVDGIKNLYSEIANLVVPGPTVGPPRTSEEGFQTHFGGDGSSSPASLSSPVSSGNSQTDFASHFGGAQFRGQTGGSGIVPRGFENDNFYIGASSGEGYAIFPSRMMGSYSGRNGGAGISNTTYNATANVDPGVLSPAQMFQVEQRFLNMFQDMQAGAGGEI